VHIETHNENHMNAETRAAWESGGEV